MSKQTNSQKLRRMKRNGGSKQSSRPKLRPDLELHPVYPGQAVATMKLYSTPALLTTTVTTGVVATSINFDPVTQIPAWDTRIQTLWKEYRVIKVRKCIQLFSATNAGMLMLWAGTTSGAPTAAEGLNARSLRFNASSVDRLHELSWVPSDPADLAYKLTSASSTPAFAKVYTDAANFGAPIAVTILGLLTMEYTLQFREFQNTAE